MDTRRTVQVLGFMLFIFIAVQWSVPGKAAPANYDYLLSELKKDDWSDHFITWARSGALDDEESLHALAELIDMGGLDWRIRIRGMLLLGETGNPGKVDVLMEKFFNGEGCPAIKTTIVSVLGNFGDDPRVLDVLIAGMNDPEIEVVTASIESMGKNGNPDAIPFLVDKLNDKRFAVRLQTVRALGRIKNRRVIPFLRQATEQEGDENIRREALSALSRIR